MLHIYMRSPIVSVDSRAPSAITGIIAALLLLLSLPVSTPAMSPVKRPPDPARRITASALPSIGEAITLGLEAPSARKPSESGYPELRRDGSAGTPVSIGRAGLARIARRTGKSAVGATPFDAALALIESDPGLFRLRDARNELQAVEEYRDSGGRLHLRLRQMWRGVPVRNCGMVLHFDSDGRMYAFTSRYIPTPAGIDSASPAISAGNAVKLARKYLEGKTRFGDADLLRRLLPDSGPSAEPVILADERTGSPRAAWQVEIRPNLRERWLVFPDSRTGEIIEAWQDNPGQNGTITVTARDALGQDRTIPVLIENGVYFLADSTSNILTFDAGGKIITTESDIILISSPTNIWSDSIAVSAYANLLATYDYYSREHGRAGVDGARMQLPAIVHYTPDGSPYFNAFWAGSYMAFGDGRPYAAALDVVAHELTHGVTQFTVGLEYRYQSGALSEAISDLMAAFMDPDWLMGEDLPGGAIRDVLTPWDYGFPQTMDDYQVLSIDEDNGGVHINMGIPSRAVALLAESIGRDKAADLLYHVLDSRYISPRAQFSDFRLALAQAAVDLYGAESSEALAVAPAFEIVGITGDDPAQPPKDVPPPAGGEWFAFLYEGRLALARPGVDDPDEFTYPTDTPIYIGSASPVSICRDGSRLVFVDAWNNLWGMRLDTLETVLLDDSGEWSSVALSCDGVRLAATTIYADSTIFIFNLEHPEQSKAVHLYTPGSELARSYTSLYADALDWNLEGSQLLFDQFNRIPVHEGDPIEFWDVNILEVDTEIIVGVQLTTDRNIQSGNPSWAETTDRFIICDLIAPAYDYTGIVSVDLFTLNAVEVRRNRFVSVNGILYPNTGIPRYAPDDRAVIFQQYSTDLEKMILLTIPLKEDRMSPDGDALFRHDGSLPRWFILADNSIVEEGDGQHPEAFSLGRNHPNPFNPATIIPFVLSAPVRVTLEVLDILGRRVQVLTEGILPAGEHTAAFDGSRLGSGVYFYRLRAGSAAETRKMLLLK